MRRLITALLLVAAACSNTPTDPGEARCPTGSTLQVAANTHLTNVLVLNFGHATLACVPTTALAGP